MEVTLYHLTSFSRGEQKACFQVPQHGRRVRYFQEFSWNEQYHVNHSPLLSRCWYFWCYCSLSYFIAVSGKLFLSQSIIFTFVAPVLLCSLPQGQCGERERGTWFEVVSVETLQMEELLDHDTKVQSTFEKR